MWFLFFNTLLLQVPVMTSQVLPVKYAILINQTISTNGSSKEGQCSNITYDGENSICGEPNSSVLFDGNIPTLTGLDGNMYMWASQLLTLEPNTNITLDFTNKNPKYVGVRTVDIVMFNCPEWGISVQNVRFSTISSMELLNLNPTNTTACDRLVRICMKDVSIRDEMFILDFFSLEDKVYLAEIKLYSSNVQDCMPGPISTQPDKTSPHNTGSITSITPNTVPENKTSDSTSSSEDSSGNIAADNSSVIAIATTVAAMFIILLLVVITTVVLLMHHCVQKHHGSAENHKSGTAAPAKTALDENDCDNVPRPNHEEVAPKRHKEVDKGNEYASLKHSHARTLTHDEYKEEGRGYSTFMSEPLALYEYEKVEEENPLLHPSQLDHQHMTP